jgi:hypothetical protein
LVTIRKSTSGSTSARGEDHRRVWYWPIAFVKNSHNNGACRLSAYPMNLILTLPDLDPEILLDQLLTLRLRDERKANRAQQGEGAKAVRNAAVRPSVHFSSPSYLPV